MTQIGKYELKEEIGRGGFGSVHLAHDTSLDVPRAIKILHPMLNSDPAFIQRFRREAQVVARLRHPNIIPVYDLGQTEGWLYIAMGYMPGGSLRTRIRQGRIAFQEATRILSEVAQGLAFAHGQEIIHRDIKPENILFDEHGSAQLGDFGFARSLMDANTSTTLSLTGGALGTPAYMAPEAWDGHGWTAAADVYSLACVFVEMLTGQVLFDANSPVQAMKKHVIDGPILPEQWPDGVPAAINSVLLRALAKEVEDRYQDVLAFVQDVQALASGDPAVVSPEPSSPPPVEIRPTSQPQPIEYEAPQTQSSPPAAPPPAAEPKTGPKPEPEVVPTREDTPPARTTLPEPEMEEQPEPPVPSGTGPPMKETSSRPGEHARPGRKIPGWLIALLIAPGTLLLLLFELYPLFNSLLDSFEYRQSIYQDEAVFVGLENYLELFNYLDGTMFVNMFLLLLIRTGAIFFVWRILMRAWRQQKRITLRAVTTAVAPLPFIFTQGILINIIGLTLYTRDVFGFSHPLVENFSAHLFISVVDAAAAVAVATGAGFILYALVQNRYPPGQAEGLEAMKRIRRLFIFAAAATVLQASYPSNMSRYFDLPINRIFTFQFGQVNFGAGAALLSIVVLLLLLITWRALVSWKREPLVLLEGKDIAADTAVSTGNGKPFRILAFFPLVIVLVPYIGGLAAVFASGWSEDCDRLSFSYGCDWSWMTWLLHNLMIPGAVVTFIQVPVALLTAYALVVKITPEKKFRRLVIFLIGFAAITGIATFSAPNVQLVIELDPYSAIRRRYYPHLLNSAAILLFILYFKSKKALVQRAVRSGRSEWDVFRKELFPGILPLIMVVWLISVYGVGQEFRWSIFIPLEPEAWSSGHILFRAFQDYRVAASFVPKAVFPVAIPTALAIALVVRNLLRRFSLGTDSPDHAENA